MNLTQQHAFVNNGQPQTTTLPLTAYDASGAAIIGNDDYRPANEHIVGNSYDGFTLTYSGSASVQLNNITNYQGYGGYSNVPSPYFAAIL